MRERQLGIQEKRVWKRLPKPFFSHCLCIAAKLKEPTILNNITCHFSLILITEKIIDTTIIPKITNVLLIPDVTVQQYQLYMLNSYPYQCFPFEFNDHALKKLFQICKYMKTLLLEFQWGLNTNHNLSKTKVFRITSRCEKNKIETHFLTRTFYIVKSLE